MDGFETVAKVGEIPEGEGKTVLVNRRMVAVFCHGGDYFAIDDLCPHQGASLGAGAVDNRGAVACPWHAWRFDIRDGGWCDNPSLKVAAFETRVVGDEVQVAVPPQ
ncbi:MAG: nitrite reductase small subunit NirD [Planctomycetota bacterium]